mgnify:CR=1 FL=1
MTGQGFVVAPWQEKKAGQEPLVRPQFHVDQKLFQPGDGLFQFLVGLPEDCYFVIATGKLCCLHAGRFLCSDSTLLLLLGEAGVRPLGVAAWIALIAAYPALVRRPVAWDGESVSVGFSEKKFTARFG